MPRYDGNTRRPTRAARRRLAANAARRAQLRPDKPRKIRGGDDTPRKAA